MSISVQSSENKNVDFTYVLVPGETKQTLEKIIEDCDLETYVLRQCCSEVCKFNRCTMETGFKRFF